MPSTSHMCLNLVRMHESVLDDFPSHHGGDSERFRLTVDLFSDHIWSCREDGYEAIEPDQTD